MPILSYVLELMGYTTSCVGINLGDSPQGLRHPLHTPHTRLIPPHSVEYPHTSLASLKYCYNVDVDVGRIRKCRHRHGAMPRSGKVSLNEVVGSMLDELRP